MKIVSIKIGDDEKFYDPKTTDWKDIREGLVHLGTPELLLKSNFKMSCIDKESGEEFFLDVHSFEKINDRQLKVTTTKRGVILFEGDFESTHQKEADKLIDHG